MNEYLARREIAQALENRHLRLWNEASVTGREECFQAVVDRRLAESFSEPRDVPSRGSTPRMSLFVDPLERLDGDEAVSFHDERSDAAALGLVPRGKMPVLRNILRKLNQRLRRSSANC